MPSRFLQQWNHRVSLSPAAFRELLLSHHPDHPCFDDDVIRIRGHRICAGCLFAYPVAILVLLLLRPTGMESVFLALAFALLSQARRFVKNRLFGHMCRAVAGLALGFGIAGGYWAVTQGNWAAVVLLAVTGTLYAAAKAWSMHASFIACEHERRTR